jgi:UDP-galactopyranose mutase
MVLNNSHPDLVIVGSGLFGLTIAELVSRKLSKRVMVIEKRSHIGGNSWSEEDPETGIEIHKYGSHLFHTSNTQVWNYVNKFSEFSNYQHKVWAVHKNRNYSLPINLSTLRDFFGCNFSPEEAQNFFEKCQKKNSSKRENFEEEVISQIGVELYEAFYLGYTRKQWQTEPKLLPKELGKRLAIRSNLNTRYFSDTYEGLPTLGYSGLISNMSANPLIEIIRNTEYSEVSDQINPNILTIYTGAIDAYFGYTHGSLGWRTLDFEQETHDVADFQGTSVVNYPDLDVPYTRIHEFKHLHPERKYSTQKTVIYKEFSRFSENGDEPFYPINTEADRIKLKLYRQEAKNSPNIIFGGRLGSYKYLDMDMAIASAISCFNNNVVGRLGKL